jgi:hypothetical protein
VTPRYCLAAAAAAAAAEDLAESVFDLNRPPTPIPKPIIPPPPPLLLLLLLLLF